MSTGNIEDRLARLEAAEAIRATLQRYARAVDTRDWELLASVFATDAAMDLMGTVYRGPADIVAALRGMLPESFGTKHLIGVPDITPAEEADRYRALACVAYEHTHPDARGWGTYAVDLQVVDGTARVTRMDFVADRHVPSAWPQVTTLAIAEAAREACWQYALAVDTLDFALLADSFTEDASLTTRRGTRTGRGEVVAYYETALADPVDRRHFIVNPQVEVTGPDTATVRSLFAYTFAGEGVAVLGWGRYVDEVRMGPDGRARITAKSISIDVHADPREGWAR